VTAAWIVVGIGTGISALTYAYLVRWLDRFHSEGRELTLKELKRVELVQVVSGLPLIIAGIAAGTEIHFVVGIPLFVAFAVTLKDTVRRRDRVAPDLAAAE
jgi:hypothetical protein